MRIAPGSLILTDIEGTTSSIAFVRDVLFPYARQRLPGFIAEHAADPDVRRWLDAVAVEMGAACDDRVIAETLQGWIDQDRKHTALKALQGMLWREGYERGDYRAHFYPDAAAALREWHDSGRHVAVFSSGSVAAQHLFFGYSDHGDLSSSVRAWFDTETAGPKREAGSYTRIADELARAPSDITFLSDIVAELDAAREAGFATLLVDRREDYPEPRSGNATHNHLRIESFAGIT